MVSSPHFFSIHFVFDFLFYLCIYSYINFCSNILKARWTSIIKTNRINTFFLHLFRTDIREVLFPRSWNNMCLLISCHFSERNEWKIVRRWHKLKKKNAYSYRVFEKCFLNTAKIKLQTFLFFIQNFHCSAWFYFFVSSLWNYFSHYRITLTSGPFFSPKHILFQTHYTKWFCHF